MVIKRGFIFDLDDTLYLERDYVDSGFSAVAGFIALRMHMCREPIHLGLRALFNAGRTKDTFDRWLEERPELQSILTARELIKHFRDHKPALDPLPGVSTLLKDLVDSGGTVGLLSDGATVRQKRKLQALGLSHLFDPIVLTGQWGEEYWKPHARGFRYISAMAGLRPTAITYIGDNPAKDFLAPKRLGWRTVRLRIQGQLHCAVEPPTPNHSADRTADSVVELVNILKSWS